ncbi:MAG: AlpA family transcriptional regulator [Pseudomonadota bacterium]
MTALSLSSTPSPAPASRRLIRIDEVLRRTGLGRTSIYNRIATGEFPRQIPLGPHASAWVESEVDEWINKRIAERDVED